MSDFRPCFLIPVYNHEHAVGQVVEQLLPYELPIVLVDDGSCASCAEVLDRLQATHPSVTLVRHHRNGGKGQACMTGFFTADNLGCTHAFQLDADGQHDLTAVQSFLDAARARPNALICGYPIYDESVPSSRQHGRKVSNWWVAFNARSNAFKDAMCGFRVYPLVPLLRIVKTTRLSKRMEFDCEILVHWAWQDNPVENRPVKVTYPTDGVSHFRMIRDNVQMSCMYAKLCCQMLAKRSMLNKRRHHHA